MCSGSIYLFLLYLDLVLCVGLNLEILVDLPCFVLDGLFKFQVTTAPLVAAEANM